MILEPFEVNKKYNRYDDIFLLYGGSYKQRMSSPKDHPFIFLFVSNESLECASSLDMFVDSNTFQFSGYSEKKKNNGGTYNSKIREHAKSCKRILLFIGDKDRPNLFEYKGVFNYSDERFEYAPWPAIVFKLVRCRNQKLSVSTVSNECIASTKSELVTLSDVNRRVGKRRAKLSQINGVSPKDELSFEGEGSVI